MFGNGLSPTSISTALQEDISFPLVFIDGITRCGKSSLSGILPSLTNMEHIQFSTILELVVPGLFLQKLDTDYAKSLTRIYLNELSYNLTLGRNVNFRDGDQTGIQNYKDPDIYYSRLIKEDGPAVIDECRVQKNYIPFQTHDFLVNVQLLNVLDLNFKMLSLWRDPIDNIFSWWTRGWGDRFMNSDPSVFTLLVTGSEGQNLPWYCQNRDYDVNGLNAMECCVVIATDLLQRAFDSYYVFQEKNKIQHIFFEDLCVEPKLVIEKICKFLDVEPTASTIDKTSQARFPRQIVATQQLEKIAEFESNLRPDIFVRLMDLSERYRLNRYGLA